MSRGMYRDWITEEGLLKVEGWARDGLIDEQIAHNIGISRSTLYMWKNKYPEFDQALRKGKEVVDRAVENALLKNALGFTYKEAIDVTESDGDNKKTKTEIRNKQALPDTTAQIFWLKNRKPEQWRDKKQMEVSGSLGIEERARVFEKYLKEND